MSDIGTSTLYGTEWMIDRLRDIRPSSIVDVGCGWGRWGFLAREFLELWAHRFTKQEWAIRIDAVDIHPGTWTPVHEYIYDSTHTMDIMAWKPEHQYDVAICGDVVEHLPRLHGEELLRRLLGWCDNVLLGIPLGPGWDRPGFDDNPHEAHLARWDDEDFAYFDVKRSKLTKTEDGLGYGLYWLT